MSTGPSSATIDSAAPSCQLDAVIATYACSVNGHVTAELPAQPEAVDAGRHRRRQVDERRVEPAGRDGERRVVAETDADQQRAGELDAAQLRVAQPGVDGDETRLDVVVAEHVGGELDEPRGVDLERWRRRPDRAEQRQPGEPEVAAAEHAGELGEDGHAGRDEASPAPVGLDRRSRPRGRPARPGRSCAGD